MYVGLSVCLPRMTGTDRQTDKQTDEQTDRTPAPHRTCQCFWVDAVIHNVTEPLLAALPRETHQLGGGAVGCRHLEVVGAQRHTGHTATQAMTQLCTRWLECSTLLKAPTVDLTAQCILT